MAWTSTSGVGPWTKSGTTRDVVLADEPAPQNSAITLQIRQPADNVYLILRGSPDGRSGIEVMVDAANVVIRLVEYAVTISTYSTTPHTLTAGSAFTLDVRPLNNNIEVRLNGDTTALVTQAVGDQFEFQDKVGFGSLVNGAIVQGFSVCELVAETADRADVLVMVRGGELWAATDLTGINRIAAGVMVSVGDVDMAELEQKLYMVDGTNARIFDPADLSVTPYTPTAGAGLIGAVESSPGVYIPGTTTATIIERHISRLWFAGMKGDPQNVVATAVDDPLDLDTGIPDLPGRAFALNVERGKIGQPVLALQSSSATTLIVGCSGSFWAIRGDPTLGAVDVTPLTLDVGVSGREATTLASEGLVIAHTGSGLYMVPEGGAPTPVSMGTLTQLIQVDNAATDYRVQVIRDTRRHGTHVFLTLREAGESVHLWYDERIGGYTEPGGFFPESLPDDAGPTAVVIWNGLVVMGGRDGQLYIFDDDAKTDAGTTIDSYAAGSLLHDGDTFKGILHGRGHLLLSDDSDAVVVKMYGGVTAEEAFDPTVADLLWTRAVSGRSTIIDRTGMGSFLVVNWESNGTNGTSWLVEGMQFDTTATDIRRRSRAVPPTPPVPCTAPVPASGGGGFDPPDPGGIPVVWPDLFLGIDPSGLGGGVGDTGGFVYIPLSDIVPGDGPGGGPIVTIDGIPGGGSDGGVIVPF